MWAALNLGHPVQIPAAVRLRPAMRRINPLRWVMIFAAFTNLWVTW